MVSPFGPKTKSVNCLFLLVKKNVDSFSSREIQLLFYSVVLHSGSLTGTCVLWKPLLQGTWDNGWAVFVPLHWNGLSSVRFNAHYLHIDHMLTLMHRHRYTHAHTHTCTTIHTAMFSQASLCHKAMQIFFPIDYIAMERFLTQTMLRRNPHYNWHNGFITPPCPVYSELVIIMSVYNQMIVQWVCYAVKKMYKCTFWCMFIASFFVFYFIFIYPCEKCCLKGSATTCCMMICGSK